MAQGLINNGVSVTKNFTDNELELLVDYEVTGSAVTQVDFTSLNIQEDEEVFLKSTIVSSSGNILSIFVNGNITQTNYYTQSLFADNVTVTSARNNNSYIIFADSGTNVFEMSIKLTNNGYFTFNSNDSRSLGSSIKIMESANSSVFNIASITKLSIVHGASNAIGIGSRFQLYKVKGQVQQTWATT